MPKSKSESSSAGAKPQRAAPNRPKPRSITARKSTTPSRAKKQTALDWKKIAEQRAAELAIINSVQAGLAAQLNLQAIFDLVGDKIRDTFDAQSAIIVTYDRQTNLIDYPYIYEKGERLTEVAQPLDDRGFTPLVMRTRQPLMVNQDMLARAAEVGPFTLGGGEVSKSGVWFPLVVGEEARGAISIQNVDHENAFDESDFRLLQTLASSLSVAFENARLLDETTRRANDYTKSAYADSHRKRPQGRFAFLLRRIPFAPPPT